LDQPVADATLDQRHALLIPGLVALQELGGFAFKDRWLNRVERGKRRSSFIGYLPAA
jgi:hypothetical protein